MCMYTGYIYTYNSLLCKLGRPRSSKHPVSPPPEATSTSTARFGFLISFSNIRKQAPWRTGVRNRQDEIEASFTARK